MVSEQSSTNAFYASLLENDLGKSFQKLNAINQLIHDRKIEFSALVRLARAELEIAFKKMARDLDPSSPVAIFGDHGFRLNPEGTAYTHGGSSTLERLTPVFLLVPI